MSKYTSLSQQAVGDDAHFALTFVFGIPEDTPRLTPEATVLAAYAEEPLKAVISSKRRF